MLATNRKPRTTMMHAAYVAGEQPRSKRDPRSQLMQALQEQRFVLYAQPIRPLAVPTTFPRCLEVSLRLQDQNQHVLPPDVFFLVANRYNLMQEIDLWVVRNVIKWCLEKWRSDPAWRMPLCCVSLAAASLCERQFAGYVRGELLRTGFPAAYLCFEIAEPDVNDHHAAVQAFMAALRPLGCRFMVQSFGKTPASFARLRNLRFDFLKIDGVLVQNMLTTPDDLAKIRDIAAESRRCGLRTIAEFVESNDTLLKLRGIGIDYAQGFGIGRPGPIAQMS